MATREDVIAALKAKGYNGPIPGDQQGQPQQAQQPQNIQSMLNGVQPNMGQSLANAMSVLGGGKPIHDQSTDYRKIFAEQAIKNQFENDPNSLDYKSKMSTIALNDEKAKLARAGYIQDETTGAITKAGKPGLTPGQQTQQDNSVKEIYATREMNQAKGRVADNALQGAENIPQGWWGKTRLGVSKSWPGMKGMLGVNDSMIQDAQEMKMALTMGSLAETAHTKGAISDQEMMLFKEASANDDFNNPGVIPVIKKIKDFMMAEESGMYGAYQRNYGEDPRTWFGEQGNNQTPGKTKSGNTFRKV